MKRLKFILVTGFFFIAFTSKSQDTISFNSFEQANNHIWGLLDTSIYPSGIIINKIPTDSKFHALNGNNQDSSIAFAEYLFYLNNLRMAEKNAFDKNKFVFDLDSTAKKYCNDNNSIPISIASYNYNYIDTSAFSSNKISKNGENRLINNYYSPSNPIPEFNFITACSLIPGSQLRENSFTIDTNLFYLGNNKFIIDSIYVHSSFDSVRRKVSINESFQIYFPDTGLSYIYIEMFADTLVHKSKFTFVILDEASEAERSLCIFPEFYSGPAVPPDVDPVSVCALRSGYNGTSTPCGEYAIWYGCGNTSLKKPIILSVGFNPGNGKKLLPCLLDENAWITSSIAGVAGSAIFGAVGGAAAFALSLRQSGWNGQWRGTIYETANGVYSKEYDGNNGNNGEDNGTKFIEKLREEGYDIVLVQYNDGSGYLQNSAYVMIEVIKQINNKLKLSGSKSEIAVGGYSAGSLYTQYALTLMEKEYYEHKGTSSEFFYPHHRCSKYISIDGEHQGANIPIGFQNHIEFWVTTPPTGALDMIGTIVAQLTYLTINSVQARQFLNYHFSATSTNTLGHWQLRDDVINEMRGFTNAYGGQVLGYPTLCRKIGVSQGSGIGNNTFGLSPNSEILRTDVKTNALWGIGFFRKSRAYYTPPNGTSVGFTNNKSWGMSFLFWGVWQWNNNSQLNLYTNMLPYDNASGSVISTTKAFDNMGTRLIYKWLDLISTFNDWGSQHLNHSFSPTASGLDLHTPGNPTTFAHPYTTPLSLGLLKKYRPYSIDPTVEIDASQSYGYPHLTYPSNHYQITPFDAIWAVGDNYNGTFKTNHFHVEDPQNDMGQFMSGELAPTTLYLSNRTINTKITPAYLTIANGPIEYSDKYQALFEARNKIYVGSDVYAIDGFYRDQTPLGDFIIDEYADVDMVAQDVVFQTGSGAINGGQLRVKLKSAANNCTDILYNPYRTSPETGAQQNISELDKFKITKIEDSNDLTIYPNPVQNEICIGIENIENITRINITSVHGMQIVQLNNIKKCIDVSELTNGLYFISIKQKNGTINSFKFIKI